MISERRRRATAARLRRLGCTMAFPQFDLATMLRCPDADPEGFGCQLRPRHDGPHKWSRCENTDGEGHRCSLTPETPRTPSSALVRHATPPWARIQTLRYDGTERETSRLAERGRGDRGQLRLGRSLAIVRSGIRVALVAQRWRCWRAWPRHMAGSRSSPSIAAGTASHRASLAGAPRPGKPPLHVLIQDRLELGDDLVAPQGSVQRAVDEYRCHRLERAGRLMSRTTR